MKAHTWIKPKHSITGLGERECSVCGVRTYQSNRVVFYGKPPLFCWSLTRPDCQLTAVKESLYSEACSTSPF